MLTFAFTCYVCVKLAFLFVYKLLFYKTIKQHRCDKTQRHQRYLFIYLFCK